LHQIIFLAGGAYSAPPDPLAGGEGARYPLPKNPILTVGPSGLGLVFSLYLSIRGLQKGLGKFLMGVLESPGKVLKDFLSVKEWEPCK